MATPTPPEDRKWVRHRDEDFSFETKQTAKQEQQLAEDNEKVAKATEINVKHRAKE